VLGTEKLIIWHSLYPSPFQRQIEKAETNREPFKNLLIAAFSVCVYNDHSCCKKLSKAFQASLEQRLAGAGHCNSSALFHRCKVTLNPSLFQGWP